MVGCLAGHFGLEKKENDAMPQDEITVQIIAKRTTRELDLMTYDITFESENGDREELKVDEIILWSACRG